MKQDFNTPSIIKIKKGSKKANLVHWMHRVMTVLTSGPRFLSTTDLFISVKRPRSAPKAIDWSCKSHSPPWSQMGQSSGWFISKNSITPSLAFFATGVSVFIFIPAHTNSNMWEKRNWQFSKSNLVICQDPLTISQLDNLDDNKKWPMLLVSKNKRCSFFSAYL